MAADFSFNSNCTSAYSNMLQLRFAEAQKLLEKEKQINPDNLAVCYIENYIDFLRAFISEEQIDFDHLKRNTDIRIEMINKADPDSPWKKYAKAEMLLHLSLAKLKWKEYLTAGYLLRKSYKLLEENQQQFPTFAVNLKGLGFFHAVIGAVPDNYTWLSNLAGMKGTISQGGNELQLLVYKTEKDESLHFLRDESMIIKIFVAMHFEKKQENALLLLDKMKKNNSQSGPLQVFIEANTLMLAGQQDKSLATLTSFQPSKDQYPLYYLNYLTGILQLNQLDLKADTEFTTFITNFKGRSFVKSAYHKLAWICLLKNDTTGYYKNLDRVLKNGNDFTDEDKQAQKEAVSREKPNLILLRSRLLFDGGNYSASLTELAGKPPSLFPSLKDQLEFTYRLARIFDKKDQKNKAIEYYTRTFDNGQHQTWYFAANAALNNGLIYEELNKKNEAVTWFKKCLSLRNHDYQNSIDQKAEAGLNRLNTK
ncbi:MAG TPA: hypothetical protein PKD91_09545 [Bacteroidia bacterium]|nr:hypothetical protein [Bacteroidia bacterium]